MPQPPRLAVLATLAAGCALLCACADPGALDPDGVLLDPGAALYDRNQVLRIAIAMDEADWDALRQQTRHSLDVIGETCNVKPAECPYTYFLADVFIDGVLVPDVGVRKKGFFGSLSDEKPSLKIDISAHDPAQRFDGVEHLTLNNNLGDPSQIKQCLGYELFARAGLPAPRCNFAVVEVNGDPLGTYTNVEPIKKAFLRRHFASAAGNLYEGALSDFRPGWVDTFERKTHESDPDRTDLPMMVEALASDTDLSMPSLEALVDLPRFYDFWAMEILLMHGDGYARNTNNFFLYGDPSTGRFSFIPWGIDVILAPDRAWSWEQSPPEGLAWVTGALAQRLYAQPEGRARLNASLQYVLAEVWDERVIEEEIDRMQDLWAPHITEYEDFIADSVEQVRQYVAGRREQLESALAAPPAPGDAPLRDPWCLDSIGVVDGRFAAHWGSLEGAGPWPPGSGVIDLVVDEESYMDQTATAVAGTGNDGELLVRLFVATGGERRFIVDIPLGEYDWEQSLEAEIAPGSGAVYEVVESLPDPPVWQLRGTFGGGTLAFDQLAFAPGTAVTGSFAASLYPETAP